MNLLLSTVFLLSLSAWASVSVKEGRILIKDDPNFTAKLEPKKFSPAGREAKLKETGQIVANTQSVFENDRFSSKWVSLDPDILKNNDVQVGKIKPARGMAYGIISTSQDFAPQLKVGQSLLIKRYGINTDNFTGKIYQITRRPGQDIIQVHFLASGAQELIAGTTCEVEVSHIKAVPYQVAVISLLHLGLEDYIVIQESPGVYYAKHITILDQDSETAIGLLPVSQEMSYVARGAILLKPLLNQILHHQRGEK